MHIANITESQDSFQDSLLLGVKELFEACENALLPIEEQLKLYKKRDLRASHAQRTSRRVFGDQKRLLRHHRVEEKPPEKTDSILNTPNLGTDFHSGSGNVMSKKIVEPVEALKLDGGKISSQLTTQWINERKQLRDNLKNFCQIKPWLERKDNKTCLEEKVLHQLQLTGSEMGKDKSKTHHFMMDKKKKTVTESLGKIVQAVLKDDSLMFMLSKYKTASPSLSLQDFSNDLSKIQDHVVLSSKEKEILHQFYFNENVKQGSFYTALLNSLHYAKAGKTPLLSVTLLENETEKKISTHQSKKDIQEEDSMSNVKALENQREIRLKEYKETIDRCRDRDVSISEAHLRKVILHPEDQTRDYKKNPVQISDKTLLSENFWKVRERKRHHRRRRGRETVSSESTELSDTDSKLSKSPSDDSRSFIVLPPLRDVAPEKYHVNLSTGRALVGRKVDCWLSAEEYGRITGNPVTMPLERERSNPNAFWPGRLLDKSRLWMTPNDPNAFPPWDGARSKSTIFQAVGVRPPNGKRCNYGYNNNELTWPTDGKYIKYGDIELNKVYII